MSAHAGTIESAPAGALPTAASGYRRVMADRFRALKTGPLELALDGADLRYVRFAGTEIVRRLYPAVRD